MSMFQLMMDCVEAFHNKMRVSPRRRFTDHKKSTRLKKYADQLLAISKALQDEMINDPEDCRWLRAHLEVEELGEQIVDMAECNEEGFLDSLTDRLYVLLGTAVTYDMPLEAAFAEVHKSNMTKEKQESDRAKDRVREKGPKYQPPDMASVLKVHRLTRNTRRNLYDMLREDIIRAQVVNKAS